MNYPFEIFLGLRYLRSRRKRAGLSVMTWLSVAGLVIGVIAVNVSLSVMNGFDDDLKSKIVGLNAHIRVTGYQSRPLAGSKAIAETIRTMKGVTAAGPFIQGQVLVRSKERAIGVEAWGVDPDHPEAIADLNKYLWNAKADLLKPPTTEGTGRAERVFLGSELARRLQVSVGDDLLLFLPVFQQTPMGMMPRSVKFQVVGLFSSDMYDYDSSYIYISLEVAQKIFNFGEDSTGVAVKVEDVDQAPEVAKDIRNKFHGEYWVRDWLQMNRNFFVALVTEKWVMGVILSLIVLVATLGIVSTLILLVSEKTREIGILKAMGSKNGSIAGLFIFEGLLIGLLGIAIGLFLSVVVCWAISKFHIPIPGGGAVYYMDRVPVKVQPFIFYVVVPVVSIVLCFLATLYPARQAAKMEPVEAIRVG